MITKENGLRYAKLIHVSVDNGSTSNSNKVYIMEEQADGQIKCEYGRVGKSLVTEMKPSHKWASVYKQKTSAAKGYTDVTELLVESVGQVSVNADSKVEAIKDAVVKKLIEELMAFANKSIQQNYKVTQEAVSEQQVNAAQEVIDKISGLVAIGVDLKHVNDMLLRLYTIIPRRMDSVKNHLFNEIKDAESLTRAMRLLEQEQSALDTMAGQVQLIKQQKALVVKSETEKDIDDKITILDQMGISIEVEKDAESLDLVRKLMGIHVDKIKQVFKVVNYKSQTKFDNHFNKAKVKKKRLYWHGSRGANWINILQSGLLIRPSGAIHTGSMFGDSIYLASDSDKSLGYTDGGRWTNGSRTSSVFLGLFEAHVGNQKHIYKHDSSCYSLNLKQIMSEGYDSVHAHKGDSLRKDEYMIYNPDQVTIKYLVEVGY